MKKYFALILVIVMQTAQASQLSERQALDALGTAVKNLSSLSIECQIDDDCKNLEIGSKACGGPQFFLLASTQNHNYSIIKYLAEKTVGREQAYNIRYEVNSDCSISEDEPTRCLKNKCSY